MLVYTHIAAFLVKLKEIRNTMSIYIKLIQMQLNYNLFNFWDTQKQSYMYI